MHWLWKNILSGSALGKEEAREKRAVIQPSLRTPLWLPAQFSHPTLPQQLSGVFLHARWIRWWYGETRGVVWTSFRCFTVCWAELLETVRNHRSSSKMKDTETSSTLWTPELSHQSFHHKEQDKGRWRGWKVGTRGSGDYKLLIKHEYHRKRTPWAQECGARGHRWWCQSSKMWLWQMSSVNCAARFRNPDNWTKGRLHSGRCRCR